MDIHQFDFELPEHLIALRPAQPRDSSRLMVSGVKEGVWQFQSCLFTDTFNELRSGDVLVFNQTRVLPCSFKAYILLPSGGYLDERLRKILVVPSLGSGGLTALIPKTRRVESGMLLQLVKTEGLHQQGVHFELLHKNPNGHWALKALQPMETVYSEFGYMPIPPYIEKFRTSDSKDYEDYQTVYASIQGSVAAPTAGLHFTPSLLSALVSKGVEFAYVTLHVGIGTFLPIRVSNITEHAMHQEQGELNAATAMQLNRARAEGRRIISVGTTSLRLLETVFRREGCFAPFLDSTDIFIYPGQKVQSIDGLITNFHLPKSSLFILVCALMGREVALKLYQQAIAEGYRFFSFGDANLIWVNQ